MAIKTGTLTVNPASYNTSVYSYASVNSSYPLSNAVGKASSNTSYAQWNIKTGSSAETYVFYKFDCSAIPADATITSISCSAKAYINQTNSSRINTRAVQLYKGTTTAKGSATTISTSTTAVNLTCGTWTRAELDDINIRIYCKRGSSNTTTTYYMRFYGATLTINYQYDDGIYQITTSLTGNGTVEPLGQNNSVKDEDFDIIIRTANDDDTIKVTDNGVDVTSQVVPLSSGDNYEVAKKSGATYTFVQDYDTNCKPGWWQSNNKGKSSSAAVATVTFTVTKTTSVKVRCICYAEATYDYFLLSAMDGSLGTSASADSGNVFNTKNSNSQNEQTYTYTNVAPGTHHFDVKYFKDSYTNSNWDTAQFIVEFTPTNGEANGYKYTIASPTANHNVIVTITANGSGIHVKVNGVWKQAEAFKKVNGSWEPISASDIDQNLNYLMHFI